MSDRSLDEFVTVAGVAEQSADEAEDSDDSAASPDPATATFRWSAGAVCDACGADASRRWRDGESFVCADCKEW